MSYSRALFAAVFFLIISVSLPRAVTRPSGELRPDAPADLAPHPQIGKNFNEVWTYQLWLNNGIQAQLELSRANFGSYKDPVCGADLALMNFKGQNYFVAREYPSRNFIFDSAKARLSVHEKIFFEGAPPLRHHLFFSTVKKGVSYFVDLTFSDMMPGAVWGDGVFHLKDNHHVGLFFHIPGAKVRGRIAINGDTQNVDGYAWMDHTFQTNFVTKLLDAGYRYVVIPKSPEHPGKLEDGYFFQTGAEVFGYCLREDNGHWILLRPKEFKALDATSVGGASVPKRLEISFEKEAATRFQRKEDRQVTSALQELGRMERFGARMFFVARRSRFCKRHMRSRRAFVS